MINSTESLNGNVRNVGTLSGNVRNVATLNGDVQSVGNIKGKMNNGTGGSGTSDYEILFNKPKINGVELEGDKSLVELGIKQEYTANDITFEDGTTFQDKYNSGELKGETGETGATGPRGEKGETGDRGEKGETGATGAIGPQGPKGDKGDQGIQGPKGDKGDTGPQGPSGTNGTNGKDGKDGKDGVDGKTPVKGTDYYTESDKQEMVGLVLAALPSSEEVSY